MTSMAKRVMTGCIAVPVLIGIVVFLPHLNYLARSYQFQYGIFLLHQ